MTLPTTVEIIEYASNGYTVLTAPDGRTIGCRLTDATLQDAEAIVTGWYMAYSHRQWIVGDFLNQCATQFGEVASQVIPFDSPLLPNASQTLSNWASVVSQYELHERLYPLSFSHYSEVAYVEKSARESLLAWAVENQASVSQLRAEKNSRVTIQNAPILNETPTQVQTAVEIDNAQLQQILMGNVRGLFSIVKQWRSVIQPGKKYRVVLEEVK